MENPFNTDGGGHFFQMFRTTAKPIPDIVSSNITEARKAFTRIYRASSKKNVGGHSLHI